jgi:hypothetical protein
VNITANESNFLIDSLNLTRFINRKAAGTTESTFIQSSSLSIPTILQVISPTDTTLISKIQLDADGTTYIQGDDLQLKTTTLNGSVNTKLGDTTMISVYGEAGFGIEFYDKYKIPNETPNDGDVIVFNSDGTSQFSAFPSGVNIYNADDTLTDFVRNVYGIYDGEGSWSGLNFNRIWGIGLNIDVRTDNYLINATASNGTARHFLNYLSENNQAAFSILDGDGGNNGIVYNSSWNGDDYDSYFLFNPSSRFSQQTYYSNLHFQYSDFLTTSQYSVGTYTVRSKNNFASFGMSAYDPDFSSSPSIFGATVSNGMGYYPNIELSKTNTDSLRGTFQIQDAILKSSMQDSSSYDVVQLIRLKNPIGYDTTLTINNSTGKIRIKKPPLSSTNTNLLTVGNYRNSDISYTPLSTILGGQTLWQLRGENGVAQDIHYNDTGYFTGGYGVITTGVNTGELNIKIDSSKWATQYDLTLIQTARTIYNADDTIQDANRNVYISDALDFKMSGSPDNGLFLNPANQTYAMGNRTTAGGTLITVDDGANSIDIRGTASTSAKLKLLEGKTNGTNSVSIKASNSMASDYTMTLPSSQTDGVLYNDGSGTMSWGQYTPVVAGNFSGTTAATGGYLNITLPGTPSLGVCVVSNNSTSGASRYYLYGIVFSGGTSATISVWDTSSNISCDSCAINVNVICR